MYTSQDISLNCRFQSHGDDDSWTTRLGSVSQQPNIIDPLSDYFMSDVSDTSIAHSLQY